MRQHSWLLALNILGLAALSAGCSSDDDDTTGTTTTPWALTSPAFKDGDPLPASATCDGHPFGSGSAPELDWTEGPSGTKSYALVLKDLTIIGVNDPATIDHGYHWVIWDIPTTDARRIPAGLGADEFPAAVPDARQWTTVNPYGYLGPCPNPIPGGDPSALVTDSYAFTLYALGVPILDYPAYDPNVSFVHTLDDYLQQVALKSTDLHTTSNAAATEFTPPATPIPPATRP